jgi:hypothetical protein
MINGKSFRYPKIILGRWNLNSTIQNI